ncbi:Hypothetical protein R9X50_00665200 [Acrodontium crateriforme]|uniref:Succinate dehydrogenase subunit C n=1 Tax=Acrodontium crateriforme TaxID=150365 RepID=A0AAQ3M8R1_9PEZI|nr:Hypothetical protein R9X50_00665200 [Acrodontium crateriforme]
MLPQRMAQQTLRRLAVQNPAYRFAIPTAAVASTNAFRLQRRLVATQSVSPEEATESILAKQRLVRPVAPHLSIYKPQITWYLSALERVTGCFLSAGFYVFGTLYLAAPMLGLHMESAVMAASFATWPLLIKFPLKAFVAWLFTFHGFNSLRHLVWDTASAIQNGTVNKTGWTVVGLSVASALGLAML